LYSSTSSIQGRRWKCIETSPILFFEFPPGLNITTSSAAVGYHGRAEFDNINFFYNFAAYKNVQMEVAPHDTVRSVDIETLPSSEHGLQIRVDVNDRHQSRDGVLAKSEGSLSPLVPPCLAAFEMDYPSFCVNPTWR
jgi:hypothetical protein